MFLSFMVLKTDILNKVHCIYKFLYESAYVYTNISLNIEKS